MKQDFVLVEKHHNRVAILFSTGSVALSNQHQQIVINHDWTSLTEHILYSYKVLLKLFFLVHIA